MISELSKYHHLVLTLSLPGFCRTHSTRCRIVIKGTGITEYRWLLTIISSLPNFQMDSNSQYINQEEVMGLTISKIIKLPESQIGSAADTAHYLAARNLEACGSLKTRWRAAYWINFLTLLNIYPLAIKRKKQKNARRKKQEGSNHEFCQSFQWR